MGARILIVDDLPETLMMLMAFLTSENYTVVTAENGLQALKAIENEMPDVIISDVMMPQMGGFELLDKFRRTYPDHNVPFIFISCKNKVVAEQIVADLGGATFLEKPISLNVLKAAIDAALKKVDYEKRLAEERDKPHTSYTRRHERVHFICETYFEGGGISGLTVASNLSIGGLFLDTFSDLPIGTVLHLRMKLRPGCEVEGLAEVCYSIRNRGVGLRFLALDDEASRQIQDTVEQTLRQTLKHFVSMQA